MADYFESGFCVRDRSWHGKETLLTEAPKNWDDARLAGGLMWEPKLVPLYFKNEATGEFEIHAGGQRVERDDTGADLGTVSGTFELITHADMGWIMEPIMEQPGCRLDTMGSVREGRQVYATVLLDEPYEIKGDIDGFGDQVLTLPYFAILNSHDGTGACKGLYTQVRVVCWNTVQASAADGDRHGAQFVLRHTSGAKVRIQEAREVVAGARAEAARWREIAEALAQFKITDDQQETFAQRFIPEPPAALTSDRVKLNVDAARNTFLFVLRESVTNSAMSNNGLGVVNAAIEYADHLRGSRSRETLVGRQILNADSLKTRAISIVRELAGASA